MRVDRRLIGWGLVLVVIGGIPLAVTEGYLDPSLVGRWPELWPLLIVAFGLSLLLTRTSITWLGSLATILVVGTMGGGLLATGLGELPALSGCGGGTGQAFPMRGGTLDAEARFEIDVSCGQLYIGTGGGPSWHLTGSDGDARPPEQGGTGSDVTLRTPSSGFIAAGRADWNLTLPQDSKLDLGLTLNAGDGNLQFESISLASLSVTVNAGSLTAVLGQSPIGNAVNVTVNAGSVSLTTYAPEGDYDLSLNAGSLKVCVPPGTPLRVRWNGTLASDDLDSLGLVKVDDQTWTTSGFSESAAHLELDVTANAGSFSLAFEGGCSGS